MKRYAIALTALLAAACGNVPGSPSPDTSNDYHPPQFAAGQCIVGTSASCVTQIPTQPAPTPQPTTYTLDAVSTCVVDNQGGADCRITARRNGVEWTSHVVSTFWAWSDGVTSTGYLTGRHVFAHPGTWSYGVDVYDDTGLHAYTSGGITAFPHD